MNLYIYEETTSTNDLGFKTSFHHGDVIWAQRQSAGRGQRGNKWLDGYGLNATFSIVLEPSFLQITEQFKVSQAVALALHQTLQECGIESRIKWTNDIYVGNKKIAGVLIENRLQGDTLARVVVGIGLNINQTEFDTTLPNPTSMRLTAGIRFEREQMIKRVQQNLLQYIERLKEGEAIDTQYHALLYRLNERHNYKIAERNEVVVAEIAGVEQQGALILKEHKRDGTTELHSYQFREVEFIIEGRER